MSFNRRYIYIYIYTFNQISIIEVGASKNGNDKIDQKIL
jgi:hypothetical protein